MRRIERPMAVAAVHWFSEAEGGRPTPPPGPTYASTAVFVLGDDQALIPGWPSKGEHFSVLLDFDEVDAEGDCEAKVEFISWPLVSDYLRPGANFIVTEGPRAVAMARVDATFDNGSP